MWHDDACIERNSGTDQGKGVDPPWVIIPLRGSRCTSAG
jgi:hypothetical protein